VSWDPLPSTFDRARRKEAYRRFARAVAGHSNPGLLPLDEVRDRLGFFEQVYIGVRPIPVAKIVGTASRRTDFDKDFLPARAAVRERWRRVEKAFPEGSFPPIAVYKVGDSYFVDDGHHRVAIAKQRKTEFIDAEVTELRTRHELPPDADIGRIILSEQERTFMRESGLELARPKARIEFTRPSGYVELLEIVKVHGFHLMMDRGEVLSMPDVAGDWYDRIYLPTLDVIRAEGLPEAFPRATEADLFLWVWQRRRAVSGDGAGMSLTDTVKQVGAQERRKLGPRARRTARKLRG
jgi:hypothetical protein